MATNYINDYEVSWSDGSWADYELTKESYDEILAKSLKLSAEMLEQKEEEFKPAPIPVPPQINFGMEFDKNGKPHWVKTITPGLIKPQIHGYPLDAGDFVQSAKAKKASVGIIGEPKPKRTRTPSIKKDDRVSTPNGPGKVWIVERDGTVCVELDNDNDCLHEFEKKEIKKIK